MKTISRKSFLKGAAALATTAAAAGILPAYAAEAEGAGVYGATARGLKGDITVVVKIAEDGSIENVAVTENGDSPFISDAAIEGVTRQMVEKQSISVEAVSGATFTSFAIMQAAREALSVRGDADRFDKDVETEYSEGEELICDLLIVGGGTAGLCASIAARTDDAMGPFSDSGLNVVLVEQLGYTGGCLRVSDTNVMPMGGTRYNEAVGAGTDTEEFIRYAIENPFKEGCLNEELYRKVLNNCGIATSQLLDNGMWMPVSDAFVSTVWNFPVARMYTRNQETNFTGKKAPGVVPMEFPCNEGGPYIPQSLYKIALNVGVDIRVSTKVMELEVADGEIKGVKVQDKANHVNYTIRARKYILAMGCIGNSAERVAKYGPAASDTIHFGCAGTNGDGQVWIEENGGVILEGKPHYQPGPDNRVGHYGEIAQLQSYCPCIMVNLEGKRFFQDAKRDRNGSIAAYRVQPDNKAFGIVSGEAVELFKSQLDYAVDHQVGWVADSLEELAALAGIDAAGLLETVEAYNAAYAKGEGVEFEVAHEAMTPIAENGPYYAFLERALCNLVDTSVKVDVNFQPVKADGSLVFANAYACGSMMVMNYNVMTGGFSHITAISSGVLAGREVKNSLL